MMMLKLLLVILVSTQAFIPIRWGLSNIKLTNVLKAPNVVTIPIEHCILFSSPVSSINAEEKELLGEYNEETNDNFEFDKIVNEVSKEEAGTRRVFVENLDSKVSWQALKDHMRSIGTRIVRVDILPGSDGQSPNRGLVEFPSCSEAREVAQQLNNTILEGKPIYIHECKHGDPAVIVNAERYVPIDCKLYVGNLAWSVRSPALTAHFEQIGPVVRAWVALERFDLRSKGYGFVEFANRDDAVKATKVLYDSELEGRKISVRHYQED